MRPKIASLTPPVPAAPAGGLADGAPDPRAPRRGKGLVDGIVQELSNCIRLGEFGPGAKLPTESAIMARFSISRTVVREALSKLQASGAVETRHGIGTFVTAQPPTANFRIAEGNLSTVADVISVLELRISLETEAAGLAAQRRTPADLEAIRMALDAFKLAVQHTSDAVAADFQFHREVARATGNRHFADLMTYLGTMIIPRTRVNTMPVTPEGRLDYLQRVNGEHESIYNAIRNQDPEAARAAMRTHLANSRDRLRARHVPV
jgi:GntR family transcriptional regulator, transcriptional repressor for pyruvate dehydrogenase complex